MARKVMDKYKDCKCAECHGVFLTGKSSQEEMVYKMQKENMKTKNKVNAIKTCDQQGILGATGDPKECSGPRVVMFCNIVIIIWRQSGMFWRAFGPSHNHFRVVWLPERRFV